jgi:hypothetical protein
VGGTPTYPFHPDLGSRFGKLVAVTDEEDPRVLKAVDVSEAGEEGA